jgi:hypothetical protein
MRFLHLAIASLLVLALEGQAVPQYFTVSAHHGGAARSPRWFGSRPFVPRPFIPRPFVPRPFVPRPFIPQPFVPQPFVFVPNPFVAAPPFSRPFHHHFRRHFRAFATPLVVGTFNGDNDDPCRVAVRFLQRADAEGKLRGDLVDAVVDDPDAATSLLYGLRAAGYHDVRLISVEPFEQGEYRAEYRLGQRDAAICS